MKESFIVYNAIEEQTAILTDEQVGQLFRAMLRFSKGGEPEINDPLVAVSFSFIRPTMEKDRRKYEEVCAKRQEAGRKGGRPKKNQTAQSGDFLTENQMVSEKADNVNVNVYENDFDYVHEDVSVSVRDSLDGQDGQTEDSDTREREFQGALFYAEKVGYQFTAKQRRRLRQWCNRNNRTLRSPRMEKLCGAFFCCFPVDTRNLKAYNKVINKNIKPDRKER